jgi:hypothetical protein
VEPVLATIVGLQQGKRNYGDGKPSLWDTPLSLHLRIGLGALTRHEEKRMRIRSEFENYASAVAKVVLVVCACQRIRVAGQHVIKFSKPDCNLV